MYLQPSETTKTSAGPSEDNEDTTLKVGLGSLLRALQERLDGEVESLYQEIAPGFRPKYYPVVRVLLREGAVPLSRIARDCGVTHSAVSQVVSEMAGRGLVETRAGGDARERIISLSAQGEAVCARLAPLWGAVHAAAAGLDAELTVPLSATATEALDALARRPFGERIREHLSGDLDSARPGQTSPEQKGSR